MADETALQWLVKQRFNDHCNKLTIRILLSNDQIRLQVLCRNVGISLLSLLVLEA